MYQGFGQPIIIGLPLEDRLGHRHFGELLYDVNGGTKEPKQICSDDRMCTLHLIQPEHLPVFHILEDTPFSAPLMLAQVLHDG